MQQQQQQNAHLFDECDEQQWENRANVHFNDIAHKIKSRAIFSPWNWFSAQFSIRFQWFACLDQRSQKQTLIEYIVLATTTKIHFIVVNDLIRPK